MEETETHMVFEVLILGSNAALPAYERNPTAQIVYYNDRLFLIDCGEGTQKRFNKFKVRRSKLEHIFISHLHGDHIFGLPGLINSFNLNARKSKLILHGPHGLDRFVRTCLEISQSHMVYELEIREFNPERPQLIMEDSELRVHAFPLKHRIPTAGYRFEEKQRARKINSEQIQRYGVRHEEIPDIKAGKDYVTSDSELIPNSMLTFDPAPERSYAFCSDTIFDPDLVQYIAGVDLLYHEATFMTELREQARQRMHSTAAEAAKVADLVGAKQLILGHFSSRYKDLDGLLAEAKEVFPDTFLGIEGQIFPVGGH